MAHAKTHGNGWHGQSLRHSNAKRTGKAGGVYKVYKLKSEGFVFNTIIPPVDKNEKMIGKPREMTYSQMKQDQDFSDGDLEAIKEEAKHIKPLSDGFSSQYIPQSKGFAKTSDRDKFAIARYKKKFKDLSFIEAETVKSDLENNGYKLNKFGKIDNSKIKSKSWIKAEYSNKVADIKDSKTILVYDDRKAGYGWRVWQGKTQGNDYGKYYSFKTQKEALNFAQTIKKGMKDYKAPKTKAEWKRFHKYNDAVDEENMEGGN